MAVGGTVGAIIARRVPMTSMPQLVAAFHSLVGPAACLVAVAAIYTPAAYGIADARTGSSWRAWSSCRWAWPSAAVTFTGSLIAFAKLNGNMTRRADHPAGPPPA